MEKVPPVWGGVAGVVGQRPYYEKRYLEKYPLVVLFQFLPDVFRPRTKKYCEKCGVYHKGEENLVYLDP